MQGVLKQRFESIKDSYNWEDYIDYKQTMLLIKNIVDNATTEKIFINIETELLPEKSASIRFRSIKQDNRSCPSLTSIIIVVPKEQFEHLLQEVEFFVGHNNFETKLYSHYSDCELPFFQTLFTNPNIVQ